MQRATAPLLEGAPAAAPVVGAKRPAEREDGGDE